MKKVSTLLLISFVLLSCNQKAQVNTKAASNPMLDSLNLELKNFKESTLIPGLAVAIVNEEGIVFQQGYGYANIDAKKDFTPQTVQPIASISKTFVGVALMKLVDQGKLTLDDKINDILPFKIVNPKFPEVPITVQHLATHTSSISDNTGGNGDGYWLLERNEYKKGDIRDDMFEFIEIISKNAPVSLKEHLQNSCLPDGKWYTENAFYEHPPGTKFAYSNNATALTGFIIEQVSKMSLDDFCKKHIFKPLGMKNTSWQYENIKKELLATQYFADSQSNPTKVSVMPRFSYSRYPAGHVITSIEDLSMYLAEMIKGYKGKGTILSKASFKTLFTEQLDDSHYGDRYSGEFNGQYAVGIFWGLSYEGLVLHDGGEIGVYSFLYFDPKTGHGGAGMINARINSFGDSRDIIRKFEKKLSVANLKK